MSQEVRFHQVYIAIEKDDVKIKAICIPSLEYAVERTGNFPFWKDVPRTAPMYFVDAFPGCDTYIIDLEKKEKEFLRELKEQGIINDFLNIVDKIVIKHSHRIANRIGEFAACLTEARHIIASHR